MTLCLFLYNSSYAASLRPRVHIQMVFYREEVLKLTYLITRQIVERSCFP